jgi:NitT/TauT family transport system substrate-binding protein
MNKKAQKIISLLMVLTLFITLTGFTKTQVNAKEVPVFKIGYLPVAHHLPLVVADKLYKDTYKNFKLELVKFSSWPELTDALNSGKIQGAMDMLELAMLSAERGMPSDILTLGHRNGDVFTVAKDINSVKDLKGKRIAIPSRMSNHFVVLSKLLKQNGMTLDDVQWIEIAPPDMPAALARGDIKGFLVGEPSGGKAVLGGYGKVLYKLQDIDPNFICCGLVMNPKIVKTYPVAIQEFVNSIVAAGNYIQSNQNEATKIAHEYMTIEDKVWNKTFEWGISFTNLKPSQAELLKLQHNLTSLKLLKGSVKISTILNDTFVTNAYKKVK